MPRLHTAVNVYARVHTHVESREPEGVEKVDKVLAGYFLSLQGSSLAALEATPTAAVVPVSAFARLLVYPASPLSFVVTINSSIQ